MSTTWVDGDRTLMECPACNQAGRVDRRGTSIHFHCFAQCDPEAIAPMVDQLTPTALEEMRARDGAAAAVPNNRTPLDLDFDAPAPPPDYLVHGLLERGTLGVLSGDTGAAKSIVASDLQVAVAVGRDWLASTVDQGRILVLDEENPPRLIRARLGALGMDNSHRDQVRYFSGLGATLGADDWLDWLKAEASSHHADLVVIDTAAAATAVDVNDNTEVARLLGHLRRIARDLHLVVLILHHERKPQAGQTRDTGQAMMGARQWAGQADTHLSLAVATELVAEPTESGHQRLTRRFKVALPKSRDGETSPPAEITVTSEKDPARRLLWMSVDASQPEIENSLTTRALTALQAAGQPLSAAKITAALKARKQDVTDALRQLEAEGRAKRDTHGWSPVPKRPEQPGTPNPWPQAQVFPGRTPLRRRGPNGNSEQPHEAPTLNETQLIERLEADFDAIEVTA